ncbi:hypothetical protein ACFXBB_31370 [Streptomyces scopuliridis]|uniref:hypothetical protein n=1 Tax=Streptomyces scopuliridis TaxID=452529 RepID=UPI00369E77DA
MVNAWHRLFLTICHFWLNLRKSGAPGWSGSAGAHCRLLESAAEAVTATPARSPGAAVEALLRLAVSCLDAGTLRTAADYTLGLAQGTRDWPASSRRARAASALRVLIIHPRRSSTYQGLTEVHDEGKG